ncbi:MAG: RNA-directed DNA polymerase [Oscillospiraceae bacterium]|nr:RNA-directed DNA polymerase [Oscillospiraceae bacterium]
MDNEINTSRDGADYDRVSYQPGSIITDANNLYDAWLLAKKGSAWKPKVQMFEMNWLSGIAKLQREIDNRTYKPSKPSEFIIRERGKERVIHGEQVRDRIVEHSLNDNVVIPSIRPYLIHDNAASLEGKGVSFTRKRLVGHLVNYYSHCGNQGYILLIDFKKYYDNIHHDILLKQFGKYIQDETAMWLLDLIVRGFEVDVSYMSDEEYANCLSEVFNAIEYQNVDKSFLTGEKFMKKHLDIGNQTSQSAGILYPAELDNYIKIVLSERYYARYMDDSYIIHQSREHLQEVYQKILVKAREYGLIINEKKTYIAKLDGLWRFLQVHYSLTDTGRIVRKINPQRLTVQRRKMKKLAPIMTEKEFHDWVKSWIKTHREFMSKQQYKNMITLYNELKEETQKCTQ